MTPTPLLLVTTRLSLFISVHVVCAFIRYYDPLDGTYFTLYIYLL